MNLDDEVAGLWPRVLLLGVFLEFYSIVICTPFVMSEKESRKRIVLNVPR